MTTTTGKAARLLFVDHNVDALNEIFKYFDARGYEVEVEFSGRKVIEGLGLNPPHVAVISMLTADINGMEVCREVKEHPRCQDTRVILVFDQRRSPKFINDVMQKAGARGYLEKPFDIKALSDIVEKQLPPELIPRELGETERTNDVSQPVQPGPTIKRPNGNAAPDSATRLLPAYGSSEDCSLPELFLAIFSDKLTCVVTAEIGAGGLWRVEFDDGVATLIRSPFIEELSTGRLLLNRETIDARELEQACRRARELERPLGEILIEDRSINPHELHAVLADQLRLKIGALLKLTVRFYKVERARVSTTAQVWSDDYLMTLFKEIRSAFGLDRLEKLLYAQRKRRVRITPKPTINGLLAALNLNNSEKQLFEKISGKRTLGDLMAESELNLVDTFKLLLLLLLSGAIHYVDSPAGPGRIDFSMTRAESRPRPPEKPAAAAARPSPIAERPTPAPKPEPALRGEGGSGHAEARLGSRAGEIEGLSLMREIVRLHKVRATGRLGISSGEGVVVLEILSGRPLRIAGMHNLQLTLGEIMVNHGWIKPEQRDRALKQATDEGRKLGEVLLYNNAAPPHRIFEALQEQLKTALSELLAVSGGTWEFVQAELQIDPALSFQLSLVESVADYLLHRADQRRIAALISKQRNRRPILNRQPEIALDSLLRQPDERAVLRMLDGRGSVSELFNDNVQRNPLISAVVLLGQAVGALELQA